jgi:hypothetical protein
MAVPVCGVLLGVLLSGCASSHAASLAHQACAFVAKAERLRNEAASAAPAQAATLRNQAFHQLVLAGPYAALAAGDDPTYQALSANLAEVERLPTYLVFPALRSDCSKVGPSTD